MRSLGRPGICIGILLILLKLCQALEITDSDGIDNRQSFGNSQSISNTMQSSIGFGNPSPISNTVQGGSGDSQTTRLESVGPSHSTGINTNLGNPFTVGSQTNLLNSNADFDPQISDQLGRNVLDLGIEIGRELLKTSSQHSEVYSPASIYGALALLLLGSNGQTYTELMNIMGFTNDGNLARQSYKIHEQFGLILEDVVTNYPIRHRQNPNWKLKEARPALPVVQEARNNNDDVPHNIEVVNGLFIQDGYSLRTPYARAMRSVYHSEFKPLDFLKNSSGAKEYINNWAELNTHGKIKNMIDDIDPNTKIILASALYFKAMWEKTFFEGATMLRDFFPDGVNNPSIQVEMMAHGGVFPYYDSPEYDCRIIAFPYKQNLTTMYVIMPHNSTRQKLKLFQERLTARIIDELISKMEWKTSVILFPKMHLTNSLKLEPVLGNLGLTSLFNPSRSDLSLMSPGIELPVYDVSSATAAFAPPAQYEEETEKKSTFDNLEDYLVFSSDRQNNRGNSRAGRRRRTVTYKVMGTGKSKYTLDFKDLVLNKRIEKAVPMKKTIRTKRDAASILDNLKSLDILRGQLEGRNPGLFADNIIHKVDIRINEKGTEGGAATYTSLYRTGTDIVFRTETPFIFMIRHDETKLPIFYGTVYQPTNF